MVTADLNGNDVIYALAIQPDGKIIAVGKYVNIAYNTAMARFNADGSLDDSFSGDGLPVADIGAAADYAQGVAVDSDGRIIVCGTSGGNMYTARFTAAGVLDSTFDGDGNSDGIVYADFGGSDTAYGVLIQHDGKLVICGRGGAVPNYKILRYEDDGATDTGFGTNGVAEVDFGGWDIAFGVAVQLQSDGKLILAGSGFGIARFTADGDLDTSFSDDGTMAVNFTGTPQAYAVAVQADGGIVAVGKRTATYTEFAIARVMGGPVLEERLFAIHDANYNVTGIVDAEDGSVVERFAESPYGTVTYLNPDWTVDTAGSDFYWDRVHQGLMRDVETGLVYNRSRYLQTSVGRFTVRDFIGYGDGINLYQCVGGNPMHRRDPTGRKIAVGGGPYFCTNFFKSSAHGTCICTSDLDFVGVNIGFMISVAAALEPCCVLTNCEPGGTQPARMSNCMATVLSKVYANVRCVCT